MKPSFTGGKVGADVHRPGPLEPSAHVCSVGRRAGGKEPELAVVDIVGLGRLNDGERFAILGRRGQPDLGQLRAQPAERVDGALVGSRVCCGDRAIVKVLADPDAAPASNRIARSAAVRAMKPGVSSDGASGTLPPRGTRPNVGLMPATPQSAAGIRMEPPVSLATAAGTRLAATAAADPPLEPPQMNSGLCGFRVPEPPGCSVVIPHPNSCER